MKYKVEKGIPIPSDYMGPKKNPSSFMGQVRDLKKGESIFVPEKGMANVSAVTAQVNRKTGQKYTNRAMDGGVRIWRVS